MGQEGVRGLRIFSGNEINLPKSRETSDRQIVRMADRDADDELRSCRGGRLRALSLTPFSSHRYNFQLPEKVALR